MTSANKKMPLPQESENYSWYWCHKLGQGATGNVFKCRNKQTGKEYAAKVFTGHGMARPFYVNERELEVLQKFKACKHENIVKVIDIEEERHTGCYAIIMELCVESLQMCIEKPENLFGFEEEDFKQVVHDVVSGMKYLNDQGIIHRDIKPGNILKYMKNDGSFIYKLTDFGAARKLAPEETYMSIYGTEEYLHPDMYEKGVMKKDVGKEFGANVDLWSLGVTFYHIATGKLPFRPYGGRQERDTMFRITTTKTSGMISGIQKKQNGEIEWSDKLPENTRLSAGLKEHLVVILARLLESDPSKEMKFDEFFQLTQQFLQMKVFHVYSAGSGTFHTIYANPDDNFARFQELIAIQTGVSARQQDLFYNNDNFKPQNSMAAVSTYPKITKKKPIIVLGGETTSSEKLAVQGLYREIKFGNEVSTALLDNDYTITKMTAGQFHWVLSTATDLERSRTLTMAAAENVITLLKRKARKYLNDAESIENHCHSVVMKHETCLKGCEFEMDVMQTLGSDGDIPQEIIKEKELLEKDTEELRKKVKKLQNDMSQPLECLRKKAHSLLGNQELLEKWGDMNKNITNENYVGIIQTLTGKTCDIMSNFLERKRKRELSTPEMENQKFERFRVVEYCTEVKKAMEDCQTRRQTVHDNLRVWLEDVYEYRSDLKRVRSEVHSFIDMFEAAIEAEEQWRKEHMSKMRNIIKAVRTQVKRAISVPGQTKTENTTKDEMDSKVNLPTPQTQITDDILNTIETLSSETKEAKLSLQENTEKFEKFVEEFIKDLNEKNLSKNGE